MRISSRFPSLLNLNTAISAKSTIQTLRSGSYGLMYTECGRSMIESHCDHTSMISPLRLATTTRFVGRVSPSAFRSPQWAAMMRSGVSAATPAKLPHVHSSS
jgi:hypothetical protein